MQKGFCVGIDTRNDPEAIIWIFLVEAKNHPSCGPQKI